MKYLSGGVTSVPGFLAAGVHANIKKNRKDIALIFAEKMCSAAAVYTTNVIKGAPLIVTRKHLEDGRAQAIVINSGISNTCTGSRGEKDAEEMAEITAGCLKIKTENVVVASTGVIGVYLPMDKVKDGIKKAARRLSPHNGSDCAEAILTTDTVPKEVALETYVAGCKVRIGGIAKGSGMVHPNMATMLSFITSNVNISPQMLLRALKTVAADTFNMLTVDGDTSPNDMVCVLANGKAGNSCIEKEGSDYEAFKEGLYGVCTKLTRLLAGDGEGATKLIIIEVKNAASKSDACLGARSVASSNLVKTAVFGEDANWGRIITALGYSGAHFDPDKVDIRLKSSGEEELMAASGVGLAFDEDRARRILAANEVLIEIDLKDGNERATAWTCDFSYDYVKINAHYRT